MSAGLARVVQLRPDSPRPDAGNVLERHLADLRLRGLRENTIVSRRYAVRHVERDVGLPLLDMTSEVLDAWQRRRAEQVSAQTRSTEISHLQVVFRWAVKAGYLVTDPGADLIRPRTRRGVPRPVGEVDLAHAIGGAPERVRPWLVLAAYAGLRACEIARLERDDILDVADPPVLVVREGKGGKQRVIPLSPIVTDALRRHGLPSRGAVFRRRDGQAGANGPTRISHMANDYLHGIGVTASLHQLRHRMATVLYRSTQDIRLVQEILGHSSPATTAVYTAYSTKQAFAAVAAMGAVTAAAEPADPAPPTSTPAVIGRTLGEDDRPAVGQHSAGPAEREAAPKAEIAIPSRLPADVLRAWPVSDREREVLLLVAEGLTNAAIAGRLGLSPLTVKAHLRRISARVGVGNRAKLAVWVTRDAALYDDLRTQATAAVCGVVLGAAR